MGEINLRVGTVGGQRVIATNDNPSTIICKIEDVPSYIERIKMLEGVLCDIQGMCIGELAMGYNLDACQIGAMISEATGMTHPEIYEKLHGEQ